MFYGFFSSHSDKTSLEVGWILDLWHLDSVGEAPFIEDLTFAQMLSFPDIGLYALIEILLWRVLCQIYKFRLKSRLRVYFSGEIAGLTGVSFALVLGSRLGGYRLR